MARPKHTAPPPLGPVVSGLLVVVVLVAMRFLLVHAPVPVLHPDSHVYLSEAVQPYDELLAGFVGHGTWRPVAYPLFLKACGVADPILDSTLHRVIIIQLLVSSLAFAMSALVASRHVCRTKWGRMAVIALFLLLSLTWFAGPWDGAILSESMSLSGFLIICTLITLAFAPARAKVATARKGDIDSPEFINGSPPASGRPLRFALMLLLLLPLVAFFFQLRDAHVPLVSCLLIIMLLHMLRRWRAWSGISRSAACAWLVVVAGLAILQSRAAIASGRADWPLTNTLSIRVLPDPERFETFVNDHGLPAELEPLVGRFVWDGWRDQQNYIAWLTSGGRSAYPRFLVGHPGFAWWQSIAAFRFAAEDLTSQELHQYFEPGEDDSPLRLRLCAAVTDLVTLPHRLITAAGGYVVLWPLLAGLGCIAGIILLREAQTGALHAGVFALLVMIAQTKATMFFDACEDSRHNLLAYAMMVMFFWLPLLIIGDDIAARHDDSIEAGS